MDCEVVTEQTVAGVVLEGESLGKVEGTGSRGRRV